MKKIKTLNDVAFILENKCDVKDTRGYTVPFVMFVSMKLIDIINIFQEDWTYDNQPK